MPVGGVLINMFAYSYPVAFTLAKFTIKAWNQKHVKDTCIYTLFYRTKTQQQTYFPFEFHHNDQRQIQLPTKSFS